MKIPFTKAHGAKNDFLLTWFDRVQGQDLPAIARGICDRHTGVGADGWITVEPSPAQHPGCQAAIRLFNADGSEPELSGNGTRCAAAWLVESGLAGERLQLATGAGLKQLRLMRRDGLRFDWEMNMGSPRYQPGELRFPLPLPGGTREVAILYPGNPQCAVFVDDFDFDWRTLGASIEVHPQFPQRTNVSFVRRLDEHSLEVRFFERGVGETMSSGTGSTGAAAAAILRGVAQSPVRVLTPAGPIDLRWDGDIYLQGPAEIVAGGEYYF